MSHEVETMAYAGEVPWHGLGFPVSDDLTPEEMRKAAGVDWDVFKMDTFATGKINGKSINVPTGQQALVRDDWAFSDDPSKRANAVLTQVGPKWEPVQNSEAFDFFREFVEFGGMKMHTAGSLKGGKIVWALAKFGNDYDVVSGDTVENFMLFTNPHQYGQVVEIRTTPIRVVCNNTLVMARADRDQKNQMSFNHRRKFDAEAAKQTMALANFEATQFSKAAKLLAISRAAKDDVDQYLMGLFGEKNGQLTRTGAKTKAMIEEQPGGVDYAPGSWWSVFNAVTYMTDHVMGNTVDGKLESAWYGRNAKLKSDAYQKALAQATNSGKVAA